MATNNRELRTSTKLRDWTRKELREIGLMSDSYDDVVTRLIKLYKGGSIQNKGKKASWEDKI
jgi:hypothetical protein